METSYLAAARQWLDHCAARLAAFGIAPGPRLSLGAGDGLLCVYVQATQQILIAFPEPGDPQAALRRLLFRELLCCESDADLARFLHGFLPYVVAHELIHHLRHVSGVLTPDQWEEELIANACASALTRDRYAPAERAWLLATLERSQAYLAARIDNLVHPLQPPMAYMHAQIAWLAADLRSGGGPDLAECLRRYLPAPAAPAGAFA